MPRISRTAMLAAALLLAPLSALAAPAKTSLAPYFSPVATPTAAPDPDGFLRRWLVLEPIAKPNRSNQGFTSAYVRDAFTKAALPGVATAIPRDGQTVRVGDQSLQWHALDAGLFDAKLFYLAQGLGKPTYGVIFWVTTIIESDREIADAHLAVGSNSASMWWLNGAETTALFGDRRMVMDDAVSPHVTLHKGRNILRGAIINGPGLSDFCARFVDDAGRPITDLRLATR